MPLALLTRAVGTTTVDAGSLHHRQAPRSLHGVCSCVVNVRSAGQRSAPAGGRVTSWPAKQSAFSAEPTSGGAEPEVGVVWGGEDGRAEADSVVHNQEGEGWGSDVIWIFTSVSAVLVIPTNTVQ
jgi:N-methylhydantoinase A/oxoprolinase/acetone carboxylase beta subunit